MSGASGGRIVPVESWLEGFSQSPGCGARVWGQGVGPGSGARICGKGMGPGSGAMAPILCCFSLLYVISREFRSFKLIKLKEKKNR